MSVAPSRSMHKTWVLTGPPDPGWSCAAGSNGRYPYVVGVTLTNLGSTVVQQGSIPGANAHRFGVQIGP